MRKEAVRDAERNHVLRCVSVFKKSATSCSGVCVPEVMCAPFTSWLQSSEAILWQAVTIIVNIVSQHSVNPLTFRT
jgi:hypothetical protein